jgi:ankyrin repeat protein
MLCDAGADVNVKDRWGDKPLDDAKKAKMNVQEMVSILTGSTTPGQDHSIRMATMEALMEHASNSGSKLKDIKDEDDTLQMSIPEFAMGCSLLHQAAVGNLLVCRKIVLEQPKLANFQDYDRRTPLMIAAAEGQLKICKFLVSKGARINRVDRWGHAPLDDAYQFGHKGVVQFLREQGAKFGSTSQITNFITAASEGDVDEVEAFLQHGSMDINQGDYDGRTALHLAAGEGHIEIVKRLCEAGADANVQDRWGHCPLDDATNAPTNGIGITKVLVRHGGKSKKPLTALKSTLLSLLPS